MRQTFSTGNIAIFGEYFGWGIMGRVAAFLVFVASWAISTSTHAAVVESFRLGGWSASAFTNDQNGKFDSCVATASYKSGISMSVQVDANYSWWIGFSAPSW
ncbi:MAG: hypothetical protein AAF412_05105, partial [Pseudomonadota bacterium]